MSDKWCYACQQPIQGKILMALGHNYHPEHFTCAKCKKQIKDNKFQQHEGQPYCEADYVKLFAKRCVSCGGPIQNKIIKAMDAEWHEQCFICKNCKDSLVGKSFVEKDGYPFCQKCFHDLFADRCKACKKPITDQAIIALNEKWHQECFKCSKCGQQINEESFQVQDGLPVCSKCAS